MYKLLLTLLIYFEAMKALVPKVKNIYMVC